MLNYLKFIEILISLQFIFISTMVPVFFKLPFKNHINNSLELPILANTYRNFINPIL